MTETTSEEEDVSEASEVDSLEEDQVVHRYAASRGQREREEEIYEVLPATIEVRRPRHHHHRRRKTLHSSSKA